MNSLEFRREYEHELPPPKRCDALPSYRLRDRCVMAKGHGGDHRDTNLKTWSNPYGGTSVHESETVTDGQ